MNSGHQTILPHEHILVNVVPSMMVMPGSSSYTILDERGSSQKILQIVRNGQSTYLFVVMSDPSIKEAPERFYRTGVIAETEADPKDPIIFLKAVHRAEMLTLKRIGDSGWGLWVVTVKKIEDENCDNYFTNDHQQVMANMIKIRDLLVGFLNRARGFYNFDNRLMAMIVDNFENTDWGNKDAVDYFVWGALSAVPDLLQNDKQPFLESTSLPERIDLCIKNLKRRLRLLEIQKEGSLKDGKKTRTNNNITVTDSKAQNKDDFSSNPSLEIVERWKEYKKIEDIVILDVQKAFMSDFNRLKSCHPGNSEWQVFITHLNYLLRLYSIVATSPETDIVKVEEKLCGSHYGLDVPNERILDYIATKNRNPKAKAPILCFVGPPGVGKTSLGQAIANSLNLKFARMSLGGVRDEAGIRGHRATYIGALPGTPVRELIRKNTRNLVFMLDEVDKISSDFRGDPSSALLELLDPEQNHSFVDHYIDAPLDLSGVLFLCTANVASKIQPALLNRMEVIDISGYAEEQKIQIAKKFLIPKQIVEEGFTGINIRWQDDDPDKIISAMIGHTREAGVRELEREIKKVFSKWGRQNIRGDENKRPTEILITEKLIEELLGLAKYTHERVIETEIGVALGLTVDSLGSGAITYVQAQLYLKTGGEKSISQTDEAEEDLLNSNKRALTVVKNLLEKRHLEVMKKFATHSLNLQVSDDAHKIGGPSAGVPMAAAIYSELIQKPLRPFVAMTGLITTKGRIKAVGGIKGKILAAFRDGVKEVVLPIRNQRDVEKDIPEEIKKKIICHYVTHFEEVLPIVGLEN